MNLQICDTMMNIHSCKKVALLITWRKDKTTLQRKAISSTLYLKWPSGLRRCDQNQKVPGSNPMRHLAELKDPTSL